MSKEKNGILKSGFTPGSVGQGVNDRRRASMSISQAQAEQLEELDSIKIKTMYQMVEDVQILSEGLTLQRKLLYGVQFFSPGQTQHLTTMGNLRNKIVVLVQSGLGAAIQRQRLRA